MGESRGFTFPSCAALGKSLNLSLNINFLRPSESENLPPTDPHVILCGQRYLVRGRKILSRFIENGSTSWCTRSIKTGYIFFNPELSYLKQSVHTLFPLIYPHWPTQMKRDTKRGLTTACLVTRCGETPTFPVCCIPVYSCEHMISKIGNDFLFVTFTFLSGASPDSWVDSFPIELPE